MSATSVQCSKCSVQTIDTRSSDSAEAFYCCTRHHFLCSNCMRLIKMNCPICNAAVKPMPLDTTSADSDSSSEGAIRNTPLVADNKVINCGPNKQTDLEKPELIEMNVEVLQLVPMTESQALHILRSKQPIERKKQPNTYIVEKKDASTQTVDEDEPSLAQCSSTAVENEQTNYSKPIYSRHLCEIKQNMNDKAKELDTIKGTLQKQNIIALNKMQCIGKLTEALQESSGTLEQHHQIIKRTIPSAPILPSLSPRAHQTLHMNPEKDMNKNDNLIETEEKFVKTHLYECKAPLPVDAARDESHLKAICVSKSAYIPPDQIYLSDALASGLPITMSYVLYSCPYAECLCSIGACVAVPHFIHDHPNIIKERIRMDQLKNFTLAAYHFGKNEKCVVAILYLLHDPALKLNPHCYEYNYLPIWVLAKYTDLSKVLGKSDDALESEDFLLVWLAGMIPEKVDIQGNLLLMDDSNKGTGTVLKSTCVYSLRKPQDPRSVYENGKPLMLQRKLVDKMTKNGKKPLQFQVILK